MMDKESKAEQHKATESGAGGMLRHGIDLCERDTNALWKEACLGPAAALHKVEIVGEKVGEALVQGAVGGVVIKEAAAAGAKLGEYLKQHPAAKEVLIGVAAGGAVGAAAAAVAAIERKGLHK